MTDDRPTFDYIDDEALEARIALATDIILTSGTITAEDVKSGWYDAPNPADEMQRIVTVLGLTVILGGVNGAPIDLIADAWGDKRILHGAIRAMLEAVETVRAEAA